LEQLVEKGRVAGIVGDAKDNLFAIAVAEVPFRGF
jgi:hypothetical protein